MSWINAACFDTLEGEFPFNTRGEVQPSEYFNWALVNMCQQIDMCHGGGNVLFYCKAGRNRSFAGAMAYIMWSTRGASFGAVRAACSKLHQRLRVSEYPQIIHGRERRALAMDLRKWEEYLLRHTPLSHLMQTPVLVTQACGR